MKRIVAIFGVMVFCSIGFAQSTSKTTVGKTIDVSNSINATKVGDPSHGSNSRNCTKIGGATSVHCAEAIDRLEVAKVAGPAVHFNGAPCNVKYPLKSKKALLICRATVALQASGIADDAVILKLFTLQDDSVRAVSEFPLDNASVVIGQDRLQSIVLIDTGADLCYGTVVLGVGQNNFYNWGTLDEVIDESGEIHC